MTSELESVEEADMLRKLYWLNDVIIDGILPCMPLHDWLQDYHQRTSGSQTDLFKMNRLRMMHRDAYIWHLKALEKQEKGLTTRCTNTQRTASDVAFTHETRYYNMRCLKEHVEWQKYLGMFRSKLRYGYESNARRRKKLINFRFDTVAVAVDFDKNVSAKKVKALKPYKVPTATNDGGSAHAIKEAMLLKRRQRAQKALMKAEKAAKKAVKAMKEN